MNYLQGFLKFVSIFMPRHIHEPYEVHLCVAVWFWHLWIYDFIVAKILSQLSNFNKGGLIIHNGAIYNQVIKSAESDLV